MLIWKIWRAILKSSNSSSYLRSFSKRLLCRVESFSCSTLVKDIVDSYFSSPSIRYWIQFCKSWPSLSISIPLRFSSRLSTSSILKTLLKSKKGWDGSVRRKLPVEEDGRLGESCGIACGCTICLMEFGWLRLTIKTDFSTSHLRKDCRIFISK